MRKFSLFTIIAVLAFIFLAACDSPTGTTGGDVGGNPSGGGGNNPGGGSNPGGGGNPPGGGGAPGGNAVNWAVNNLATWADAQHGIASGGNGKAHIITVTGNVAIPPTGMFAYTFGNVTGITVTMQGTGTITVSDGGYLLRIDSDQTVVVKDLTLQGRDNNIVSAVEVSGGTFRMEGRAKVIGNSGGSNGGGIRMSYGGTLILQDEASVSGNTARSDTVNGEARGGGVYLSGGSFTIKGSARVEGNTAVTNNSLNSAYGGGVRVILGALPMEGGSV
jgi:hypothetical protein